MAMKRRTGFLLLASLALALTIAFGFGHISNSQTAGAHLMLGNPSNASVASSTNYLMQKQQYALSYSNSKLIPNWVSWQLNKSWLGTVPRQDNFSSDNTLPSTWYHVKSSDYNQSGYDRGHMTPSDDRTHTVADNSATFLMTNIIPQVAGSNRGPWAALEEYCRNLVNQQNNELYMIAGGYGKKTTIANGKITVPTNTWKVIVVLSPGQNASNVTTSTRVIAVDMPNSDISGISWKNYRTKVDTIESKTGYDFLNKVSVAVQKVIEARVDSL